MVPLERPSVLRRLWPQATFVLSALLAALILRATWEEPWVGVVVLLGIGSAVLVRFVSRRRTQKLLRSGDVERIISRWGTSLARVPHPETMAPLMTATAFAAYGWVERAREALAKAARGPAWEAALEHRLFVDTILLTFEGDNDGALAQANALAKLPLPSAGPVLVSRVQVLRGAVGALARAFSHCSESGDRNLLLEASQASPLVHWAMRYAAAVVSVDAGELNVAAALLQGAPAWPDESRFHRFHREIATELTRRAEGANPSARNESPSSASPGEIELANPPTSPAVVDEEDDIR